MSTAEEEEKRDPGIRFLLCFPSILCSSLETCGRISGEMKGSAFDEEKLDVSDETTHSLLLSLSFCRFRVAVSLSSSLCLSVAGRLSGRLAFQSAAAALLVVSCLSCCRWCFRVGSRKGRKIFNKNLDRFLNHGFRVECVFLSYTSLRFPLTHSIRMTGTRQFLWRIIRKEPAISRGKKQEMR